MGKILQVILNGCVRITIIIKIGVLSQTIFFLLIMMNLSINIGLEWRTRRFNKKTIILKVKTFNPLILCLFRLAKHENM